MNGIFLTGSKSLGVTDDTLIVLQWYHRCAVVVRGWHIGDPLPADRALVITDEPLSKIDRAHPGTHIRTMAHALETLEHHRAQGPDGPTFEHWTCATGHIRAERVLRLVEQVRTPDVNMLEAITSLVDAAGPAFAREALEDVVPF